ncbi:MAG: 2OG-Fe(II) oxygenase [Sphingomonadaceae bacterium]
MSETEAGVRTLFEINPDIDRPAAARRFAEARRVQVRDFLTDAAARTVHEILTRGTAWGLAWQAGEEGPHNIPAERFAKLSREERAEIGAKVAAAMKGEDYAFLYGQYPMLHAYLEKWDEGGPHDLLIEHINSEPLLDLVREVTGDDGLLKADAQATLYGPGQFLARHDDSHVAEGWRIAYVMNFCAADWRPEWGGYLLFYDEEGDVIAGFRPRFNALNLFAVPQKHNVSYVPPFAPVARFAIAGWFRDR